MQELHGTKQEICQLKGCWRRKNVAAKKNISEHKHAIYFTGGGHHPPPPTQEDQIIVDPEDRPKDIIIEVNDYDSNAL